MGNVTIDFEGAILRGITAEDVTNVVLFLDIHLSSYMTSQAINVTGGMTMH